MGNNFNGQLGDGTYNNTNLPEMIVSSNVTAIAAGAYHSLFIKSDGSLWVMGKNDNGQLGDGTTNNVNRPEQIVSTTYPIFITQAANRTVVAGSNTTFSVTASGYSPLTYQWLLNGANIAGATGSSLTVSNAGYLSQGNYSVIVTNSYGSVTSSPAILSVIPLDFTFNGTGKATADMGTNEYSRAMVIQPDGKIVLAGYASGANNDVALARFNANGTLDTTFNGTGKIKADYGGDEVIYGAAIQTDGKIIISGYYNNDFMVLRYATNAFSDTSFGGTGKITTDFSGGSDVGRQVAVQSDGKIVVVGSANNGANYDFALARYTTNGVLDTAFNGTGKVTTPIGSGDDQAYSLKVQSDGKIVVAGRSHNGSNYDFALARYTTNGVLDTTFNGTGKVTTGVGNTDDIAQSVALQSDGKIVVAGGVYNGSNWDIGLVRYTTNGILDTTFNTAGKVVTTIGNSDDFGYSVAVQTDGKIVVAGDSYNGNNFDFAVARYNSDGSLDTSFGGAGTLSIPIGSSDDHSYSVALQSDGKIVVSGDYFNGTNEDFALLRLSFPPTIGTQPTNQTAVAGYNATFGVTASGPAPLAYQWLLNGTNIFSGTNSSLTISNATFANAGNYTVIVTNSSGSVTSSVATLTVTCPNIAFTSSTVPAGDYGVAYSQNLTATGTVVIFTHHDVTAGALPPGISYVNTPSYVILTGTPTLPGVFNFTITATDINGCQGSQAYSLTIYCPTITVNPTTLPAAVLNQVYSQNITASSGAGTNSFSVTAGTLPAGLTLASTGVLSGTPTSGGNFSFTVTAADTNGCTGNRAYSLSVIIPPSILTPPGNFTVSPNGSATFTVSAGGTPPFTYQWQLNGTNISGATGSSYIVPNAAGTNAGSYTVVVCNAANCVTSSAGSLTIMGLDIYPGLLIYGPVGAAYRIDYSEDLGSSWLLLTNLTLPWNPYLFPDPTPAHQVKRFYRAVKQ
jgi:uncharacterized delta-60 repeat protein